MSTLVERDHARNGQHVARAHHATAGAERDRAAAAEPRRPVDTVVRSSGAALPADVRGEMGGALGHDFSRVRIHSDAEADRSATNNDAVAYTVGSHIVFRAGTFDPSSPGGRRLLVHELAHVVQQDGVVPADAALPTSRRGDLHEREADQVAAEVAPVDGKVARPASRSIQRGLHPSRLMLQRQAQPQAAPARAGAPLKQADEAIAYLEGMGRYVETLNSIVRQTGRPPSVVERQRAHRILNQERISKMLSQARTTFEAQTGLLAHGDARRTRLRRAYQTVLDELRRAGATAMENAEGLDAQTRDQERLRYLENARDWIEASPTTSSGLAGTPFLAADVALARTHEASIEAFLDDLLVRLPNANLTQQQKDDLFARIQNGLRRAFVTVSTGPAGTIDVRGITNPRIVDRYRRVTALLSAGLAGPQMSVITDTMAAYQLPSPVPNIAVPSADVSHVPAEERASVLFGIDQAANVPFNPPSTVQRRNAIWPVVLQVRRGAATVGVRYDLIYDAAGNVRAERLGEATARELPVAFTQQSVADKKASLVGDFGLAAVDDRPAAPNRMVAAWSSRDLEQVKAAYDLIPARDRRVLAGVTLVRDHVGPRIAELPDLVLGGFAHTSVSAAHDAPGPPAHGPPHIHYYDAGFGSNAMGAVGAPGATGPGGDWALLHEVGHFQIYRATIAANQQVLAANQQILQANALLPALTVGLPQAAHQVRHAYLQARTRASTATRAFRLAAEAGQGAAALAALLAAARPAVQARDQARVNMAANGLPAAMVAAAQALDASMDAQLVAAQSVGQAAQQIPIFISLAARFGFGRFTDYARRSPNNDDWFTETYALYLTDPDRLNQMSRRMFQWFEAGMPMDPNWNPVP